MTSQVRGAGGWAAQTKPGRPAACTTAILLNNTSAERETSAHFVLELPGLVRVKPLGPPEDVAGLVEENERRESSHSHLRLHRAVIRLGAEQQAVVDAQPITHGLDLPHLFLGRPFLVSDADHVETLLSVLPLYLHQVRNRSTARRTPRPPEVQDHPAGLVVPPELPRLAVDVVQSKVLELLIGHLTGRDLRRRRRGLPCRTRHGWRWGHRDRDRRGWARPRDDGWPRRI